MFFAVKRIEFLGRRVNILLQNTNGPCPLIAITNILLLQQKIQLWKSISDAEDIDINLVELEEIKQLVAEYICEQSCNRNDMNSSAFMEEILDLLPKLAEGMDLNVVFTNCTSFEFTREISVFDTLGITLYHGWLPDLNLEASSLDMEMYHAVKNLSYNHLVFKIVEYKAALIAANTPNENSESKSLTTVDHQLLQQGELFERFLSLTPSQLTYAGLLDVYRCMQDRQLAVLFRNNHFSTLFCVNGQIFSLVTDLGYQDEPTVVWELLDQGWIQGNSDYYDSYFQRSQCTSLPPSPMPVATLHNDGQRKSFFGNESNEIEGTMAIPPSSIILPPTTADAKVIMVSPVQQSALHRSPPSESLPAGHEEPGWVTVPPAIDTAKGSRQLSPPSSSSHQLPSRNAVAPEGITFQTDGLALSQEERDLQHALLLQMEEDRLASQQKPLPPGRPRQRQQQQQHEGPVRGQGHERTPQNKTNRCLLS